jgi:hypothetical protein
MLHAEGKNGQLSAAARDGLAGVAQKETAWQSKPEKQAQRNI